MSPERQLALKPAAGGPIARPGLALQRKCACGGSAGPEGECEECQQKGAALQRRASSGGATPAAAPPIVHAVLRSPGRPLDPSTRAFMEPRFGHDFGKVRVHTDQHAAESARAVNALAYTVGNNVVFGAGQYKPTSGGGRELLAHELAHVLQQSRAAQAPPGPGVALPVNPPGDAFEREADRAADGVINMAAPAIRNTGPRHAHAPGSEARVPRKLIGHSVSGVLQREPTRPRAATGDQSLEDVKSRTSVSTTGSTTAGSLASQEWESLFSRHFTEPDKVEGEVESSHARYIYSKKYGWIDAQHFFAHIQFAEQEGLAGATAHGLRIEAAQQAVRKQVDAGPGDPPGYKVLLDENLIDPDSLERYRDDLTLALELAKGFLPPQEQGLIKGFTERQDAKFILDNAMSAWSYEDLVSNQLGVQFFRLHGADVNAGTTPNDVRQRFIDAISAYFHEIQVVNDPATIKRLGAKLPGKERWTAPKMTEAQERTKFPELFEFDAKTHQIRIAVYDTQELTEKGRAAVASAVPGARDLRVESYGPSRFALYEGPVSHFEAALLKWAIDHAVATGPGGALIQPVAAGGAGNAAP
jgi:hypothetical protein